MEPKQKRAALRAAGAFSIHGVEVDEDAGVIRNCAVMTIGPARGHGFEIDSTSLEQLVAHLNADPDGVVMRFKHPEATADGYEQDTLGTDVGRLKNARIVGDSVRGDVYLGEWAKALPVLGNVWTYLLSKAKSDPAGFGLSAVIYFDLEPIGDQPDRLVARISQCEAVDFVGKPAANPNGLLSEKDPPQAEQTNKGDLSMDPKMKQHLIGVYGLNPEATDEEAQAFFNALSPEDQAECQAAITAELEEPEEAPVEPKPEDKPADMSAKQKRVQAITDDGDTVLAAEGKRVTQVAQLGTLLRVPENVVRTSIAQGDSVIDAKARFLKHLSESCKPIQSVKVGEDRNRASLRIALADAILIRAGQRIEKPHERSRQLSALTLIDMGRQYLAAHGVSGADTLSRPKVWEMLARPQAFGYAMLAQSTDSFANITLDAINKSLRMEYELAPSTWNLWARRATAPDFKNINRIALSDVPGLVARSEGGEIKYNVLSDNKETYTLAEYTNGIRLTRQAIINDDLDAFSRIPRAQATTAKQLEDDVCYAILTANATLSDNVALFSVATHANLSSATAEVGAPSVTTLGTGRKKMRIQTGPKGNKLNLTPRFLIVPAALETVADQYTSTNYVAAVQTNINPFAANGRTPLTPIVEPRLDDNSTTAWYLAADNARIDTVEVCFLVDEPEPVLKQETDFDTDDIKFAVRHTTAAKAIDYRGLYKNNGS